MSVVTAPTDNRAAAAPLRAADALRQWLPRVAMLVAILGAAIVLRHVFAANADVSWQITLSEKILDGHRLYTDLIEVNPPASTFLYLPAVALAHLLRWAPETVIDTLVFFAALASLAVVSHIAGRYRLLDGLDGQSVAAFALTVMVILPAQTFGQREHIALIAVLPMLATLAARAQGARPLLWHCLVAGVGAGITVCIKPYFAPAIVLAAAAAALQARSWRLLFVLENWIAAAMVAAYGIGVVVFFRAFITDVMPLLADLYIPVRLPLAEILTGVPMLLWGAAVLVVLSLRRGAGRRPAIPILLAASAGFAAAYVIQGKGWPYHAYPMLALVLIALDLAGNDRRRRADLAGERAGWRSLGATSALGVVAAVSFVWFSFTADTRAAAALVERVGPPHPSITMISPDLGIGHPLVRTVGGRWLSRYCSLWITDNAAILRFVGGLDETRSRRIAAYEAAERQRLIGEIRDGKPDIILIDNRGYHWSEWLDADPDLSALVAANYRDVGSADGVDVLKRKGT